MGDMASWDGRVRSGQPSIAKPGGFQALVTGPPISHSSFPRPGITDTFGQPLIEPVLGELVAFQSV